LEDGVPYVRASGSDGERSVSGMFRVDTGSPAPVALDAASSLAPDGRLRGLSIGGTLFEDVLAVPRQAGGEGAVGALGEPVWSHFVIWLDFGRRTLTLRSK
jgi:hypothetical protein